MIIIVFIHHIKVKTISPGEGVLTTFATLGMDLAKVYLYVGAASYLCASARLCMWEDAQTCAHAQVSTTLF